MAHKKAGGSTRNGRKSNPNMLGAKKFGGQSVVPGNIIMRQRGTKFHAGKNVGIGKDHTIYAKVAGHVAFVVKGKHKRTYITAIPHTNNEAAAAA